MDYGFHIFNMSYNLFLIINKIIVTPSILKSPQDILSIYMVDCKIKPNTLHKKAAETLMVIV